MFLWIFTKKHIKTVKNTKNILKNSKTSKNSETNNWNTKNSEKINWNAYFQMTVKTVKNRKNGKKQ